MFGGFSFYGGSGPSQFGATDYMNVKQQYFDLKFLLKNSKNSNSQGGTLDAILQSTEPAYDEDAETGSVSLLGSQPMTDSAAAPAAAASVGAVDAVDHAVCCECEAAPSDALCGECGDAFCVLCFEINHRKGRRALHRPLPVSASRPVPAKLFGGAAAAPGAAAAVDEADADAADGSGAVTTSNSSASAAAISALTTAQDAASTAAVDAMSEKESLRHAERIAADAGSLPAFWRGEMPQPEWFLERSKFIPLRLTHEERKLLRLLQGVLRSSSYADRVDKEFKSKPARTRACVLEVVSVLTALVAGGDTRVGREVLAGADLTVFAPFFQNIFELGRRHKIRNPEKMRLSYAQLMFFLQDTQQEEVREQLGFSCIRPVRTVYSLLEERKALGVLRDPLLAVATQIIAHHGRDRIAIQ